MIRRVTGLLGAVADGIAGFADRVAPAALNVGVVRGASTAVWPDQPGPLRRFHIGSVTKPFTALLLAEMIVSGEISMDAPLSKYLDVGRRVGDVRVEELASHTSGLPRLPAELASVARKCPWDPYSTVGTSEMRRVLRRCRLSGSRGRFEYSNLGYAILGLVLASAAGADFQTLLRQRILGPLDLRDTVFDIETEERLETGRDQSGRPVPHWHNPVMAGCGSLLSTVADLQRFLHAQLHSAGTTVPQAIELTQHPRLVNGRAGRLGLGWMIDDTPGSTVYWHNGGTYGFSAYLAFRPATQTGVAVLLGQSPPPHQHLETLGKDILDKLQH